MTFIPDDLPLAFEVFAIPHTPEVNRIVAFMRDAYIPCIYIPNWMRQSPDADTPLSTLVRSRALAGSCGVLRDEQMWCDYPEIQPAWLAGNLSDMIDVFPCEDKPRLYEIMLQFRQRGIQILRQAIFDQTKSKSVPKVSLLWQIMLLYREGLLREQSQGAEAYDVVLQFVEKAYVDNATALNVLIMAMYNDVESACKKIRRTILDFETWLAERYKPFWAFAESYLPPAPAHVSTNLHPSLANADRVIYGANLRTRRCLDLSETTNCITVQIPEDDIANDLRWGWVASTGMHDMGLLINQYCNLAEERNQIKEQQELWNHDLRTAMTLTTLFNLRKLVQSGSCNGVDLREASRIIPTLEEVLKTALKNSTEEQQWESRDVLMWMYFSGAWYGENTRYQQKRRVWGNRPYVSAWRKQFDAIWFNKQLSTQAHALWLTKWVDARELLQRFTYSDLIQPHPIQWYESIVQSYNPVRNVDGYERDSHTLPDSATSRTTQVIASGTFPTRKRKAGLAPLEDLIIRSHEEERQSSAHPQFEEHLNFRH